MKEYRGCTIEPQRGMPRFFGHELGRNGYDKKGYRTDWQKILFPDGTYALCPTVKESIKYIDDYLPTLEKENS